MRCITPGPYAARQVMGAIASGFSIQICTAKKERKAKVRSGFDLREKKCHFTAAPLQRLPGMAAANLFQQ